MSPAPSDRWNGVLGLQRLVRVTGQLGHVPSVDGRIMISVHAFRRLVYEVLRVVRAEVVLQLFQGAAARLRGEFD